MNTNTKVIIGLGALAVGFVLYKENKKRKAVQSNVEKEVSNVKQAVISPLTKEDKVEYILANIEAPVDVVSNFVGKETEGIDPTVTAFNYLADLDDEAIDTAYRVIKSRKINPILTDDEILNSLNLNEKSKELFKNVIRNKMANIKALKGSKKWSSSWRKRRVNFLNRKKKGGSDNVTKKMKFRSNLKGNISNVKKRQRSFADQVINREGTMMWGGYRQDGASTNASDYPKS